jgi:phosphoglycerate dehydrogenase-like enzyme
MRVAVCSRSFSQSGFLRDELEKSYSDVRFNDEGHVLEGDGLVAYLSGFDAAIVGLEKIDDTILSQLPDLKIISKYGVGLDNINLTDCFTNNVRIGWKPGVNALAVAELALSMSLTIVRGTAKANDVVKSGQWRQVVGRQLSNLTVGILGCGHVGAEFLRLLSGFETRVLVFDKDNKKALADRYQAKQVDFETVTKCADLLSIHLPYDKHTKAYFNKMFYRAMKPNSYLINTARGKLLDERELLNGLESGHLAAVALDVLPDEPPQNFKLINHPNCFVTSHIGGSSSESIMAMGLAAIEGLKKNKPAKAYDQPSSNGLNHE